MADIVKRIPKPKFLSFAEKWLADQDRRMTPETLAYLLEDAFDNFPRAVASEPAQPKRDAEREQAVDDLLDEIAAGRSPVAPAAQPFLSIHLRQESESHHWIAECPELGLIAVKATDWLAIEQLGLLINRQVEFAIKHQRTGSLLVSAPPREMAAEKVDNV